MRQRRFIQCDVFTADPTRGNALAVVLDGEGLTERQMQTFAAWTNLAETTFLLPPSDPDADYQVRIFTTTREMPFAGHPTLGSCAAWLRAGGVPRQTGRVRQQCQIGLVDIDLSGQQPAFVAPPTTIEPLADDARAAICDALSLDPHSVVRAARLDNGPVWQALELRSAAAVLAVDALRVRWPQFRSIGLFGRHDADADGDYEVRMLAPSSGMSEDPITGSLNAALACWLRADGGLRRPLVMIQGTAIGRRGRVSIRAADDDSGRLLIGGDTHILIDGSLWL